MSADPCEKFFRELHAASTACVEASLGSPHFPSLKAAYNFIADLELWNSVLAERLETKVYALSLKEYQFSLLALVQGHYRHAFGALRLYLELMLNGVYFSGNEVHLRQWLSGNKDVNWNAVVSDSGVFSAEFIGVFFEELKVHAKQYHSFASKAYRECSEYVHGNATTHSVLPEAVGFNETAFLEWNEKAKSVRLVIIFALTARYLKISSLADRKKVEACIMDSIGFMPEIRALYEIKGE